MLQNNYILTNKNNEVLSFYYGEERSIYCKKLGSNNYPIISRIIQNVTNCFSVDIGPNKEIYIFCQSYDGDIILCKLEEDTFKNKVLFKNKSENPEDILFYPIFFKNNMSLIYNTPNQNNNNFLAIKTFIGGKNWTNAENIDTFSMLPNNIFYIQKESQDNIIIAYQKKSKDIQIGYKQINNGNISDFITIHKTGYQLVDYSFVYFKGVVHYIYVIKSLFSSQVVYKRKDENGVSSPTILFEGQKIKSCNINVLNGYLYCSFIANSTLFYCQSEDFGYSFLGMSKYRKPVSPDTIKAGFICCNKIENTSINQVYIDPRNTLNIYMLPEFLPIIFNKTTDMKQSIYDVQNNQNKFITSLDNQFTPKEEKEETKNMYNQRPTNVFKNTFSLENDFMSNFNLEEFSKFNIPNQNINNFDMNKNFNQNIDNNSILENKLKMLNEQLNEKNSQILKLNDIIQNRNNEKNDIEISLRQKVKNMQTENSNLLEKINYLQTELENIKNKSNIVEKEQVNNNEENIPKPEEQSK